MERATVFIVIDSTNMITYTVNIDKPTYSMNKYKYSCKKSSKLINIKWTAHWIKRLTGVNCHLCSRPKSQFVGCIIHTVSHFSANTPPKSNEQQGDITKKWIN